MQDDEKKAWADDGIDNGVDEVTDAEQPLAANGDGEDDEVTFPEPRFKKPPALTEAAATERDPGEAAESSDETASSRPAAGNRSSKPDGDATDVSFPEPKVDAAQALEDTGGGGRGLPELQAAAVSGVPDTDAATDSRSSAEAVGQESEVGSTVRESETPRGPRRPPTVSAQGPASRSPSSSATDQEWRETGEYSGYLDDTAVGSVDVPSGAGVEKMGIVGGKAVGKSYLFQAMVYRCYSGIHAGALSAYLEHDSIRLFSSLKHGGATASVNLAKFSRNYSNWVPLPQTFLDTQKWYRLRLPYRSGLLGRKRSYVEVEYFDGAGEGFFAAMRNAANRQQWRDGYLEARVMVFCLPLWAAFPNSSLTDKDWQERDDILEQFSQVVDNFRDLREENGRTHPVKTILALTMADDRRSALESLLDKWITPYMSDPGPYLKKLRKGSGVARYLDNARRVSQALYKEFEAASLHDPRVGTIPRQLDFHGGPPWLVAVSSIDGSALDSQALSAEGGIARGRRAPVPVHVELPLLVALSERCNALL